MAESDIFPILFTLISTSCNSTPLVIRLQMFNLVQIDTLVTFLIDDEAQKKGENVRYISL